MKTSFVDLKHFLSNLKRKHVIENIKKKHFVRQPPLNAAFKIYIL